MTKAALKSKIYDIEDFAAAQEFYHDNGWTDGLPVVPPSEAAVEACLEWALMPPDQLIGIEPVRAQPITAEKLAINAVMAGCLPVHFPVVAAAWQAMLREEFLLHGVTSSTGGGAILAIINGPVRHEIGASGRFNALANSDRATAVIGRALRLGLINLLDVPPAASTGRRSAIPASSHTALPRMRKTPAGSRCRSSAASRKVSPPSPSWRPWRRARS
jgi:hypothetical protein